MNEKIICSAVLYPDIILQKVIPHSVLPTNCDRGLVFCGHRHAQCIYTKCSITGWRDGEKESGENIQGFLSNKNNFFTREEALIIALRENQVKDISQVRGNRLFSEDLY